MLRNWLVSLFLLGSSLVCLLGDQKPLWAQFAPPPGFEDFPLEKTVAKKTPPSVPSSQTEIGVYEIIRRLYEPVPAEEFQNSMQLKVALATLDEILNKRGKRIPVMVDYEAFKGEDPDAPSIYDTEVVFPDEPHQVKNVVDVLKIMLMQVPTQNATFVIRPERIVITTRTMALPAMQIRRQIPVMIIVNRPVKDVLVELFEKTGVPVVVDPRYEHKLQARISATFLNNVSLEAALRVLTESVGLRIVALENVIFVTSPSNAQRIIREESIRNRYRTYYNYWGLNPPIPGHLLISHPDESGTSFS